MVLGNIPTVMFVTWHNSSKGPMNEVISRIYTHALSQHTNPLNRNNECTETAIPDLWNVWGRVPHHCFPDSCAPGIDNVAT